MCTFIEAAELLIKDGQSRVDLGENSPSLVRDYRQRLRAYCRPFFGEISVEAVDRPKLREFRLYLAQKGLKPGTINPVMSFVSKVLKLAEEEGLLREAPKAPRARNVDSPRPAFSRDDYAALLEGLRRIEAGRPRLLVRGKPIDWELRAIVTFQVNAFLRPGDVFKLRHRHITTAKTSRGEEYLKLDFPASKGHAGAVVTMPAAATIYRRVVERRRSRPGRDDYVFHPHRPNRDYAKEVVRRQFDAALRCLDLKETPTKGKRSLYSLRHSAITFRLIEAENLDLLTLARNCRTSVEMIDRFYASSLTAEMNKDRLHR